MKGKKNVKRKIIIAIIILVVFLIRGIIIPQIIRTYNPAKSSSRSREYLPSINARKEAKGYFEYLKKKDIQNLNKLFSSDIQDNHNLEKEWNAFFEAVDGNIVSYEKISTHEHGMNVDNRKVTYSDIVIEFKNVKTDTGKLYEYIAYYQIRVDVNHPGAEGIGSFSIAIPVENENGSQEVTVGGLIDE